MVDLSDPDTAAAGKALLNAAIEYGFLYIDSRTSKFTERDVERVFKMVRWTGVPLTSKPLESWVLRSQFSTPIDVLNQKFWCVLMMNTRSRVIFSNYPQRKKSHTVVDPMLVSQRD
jgi:hypothetical protein